MNELIKNLTIQRLRDFSYSFNEAKNIFWDTETNKLRHSGEFGTYREDLVKKWLRIFVPEKFGISSGFLVTNTGAISTQCDIIIFDKNMTPKIENIAQQRFFPVETVSCIGEIKSDIDSISDLNKALIKLSNTKALRHETSDPSPYFRGCDSPYNPEQNSFDNIFSFLICKRFKFKLDVSEISYDGINQQFKHNLVLSLDDGIINYKTPFNTKNLAFPFNGKISHEYSFLESDNADLPCHIISFLTSLNMSLNLTALLSIDMTHYLTPKVLGKIT